MSPTSIRVQDTFPNRYMAGGLSAELLNTGDKSVRPLSQRECVMRRTATEAPQARAEFLFNRRLTSEHHWQRVYDSVHVPQPLVFAGRGVVRGSCFGTCINACVHVCVRVRACRIWSLQVGAWCAGLVSMNACVHVCVRVYIYIYIYTHTLLHIYIFQPFTN